MKRWMVMLLLVQIGIVAGAEANQPVIQAVVVPARREDDKPIAPPPPMTVRSGNWVAVWQAAKEACPEATGAAIILSDRSERKIMGVKLFDCVDLKCVGELLLISIKRTGNAYESVDILRADDIVRIEIVKDKKE